MKNVIILSGHVKLYRSGPVNRGTDFIIKHESIRHCGFGSTQAVKMKWLMWQWHDLNPWCQQLYSAVHYGGFLLCVLPPILQLPVYIQFGHLIKWMLNTLAEARLLLLTSTFFNSKIIIYQTTDKDFELDLAKAF